MSPVDMHSPDFPILDFKTKKSALISVIALSLLATGLYGSFQVVMAICGMDADTSHSLIVWQGVRTHGLSWIRDWLFTQDNWLLSLFPFHFLGFWLFGPKVSVAIISGWLIFLLSAFFSGAVAWRAGAKRAAIFIFLSLLHMGFYGYAGGLAAYSTTHNITNLYGLAALLILVNWSMKPNNASLYLLLAVLVSGAVSDPWMLAAYNLPILILSLIYLVRPTTRMGRYHSAKLFIVTVISILSVKTQLFGLLDFLPDMHFTLGNLKTLNSNAVFLVRDLGGLLNLVPFANWNHFLPALLSLLAVWCFIQYSIFKTLRIRNGWNEDAVSLFTVALFSIGGITTAFVISSVEAQDNSARFLINWVPRCFLWVTRGCCPRTHGIESFHYERYRFIPNGTWHS